LSLILRASPGQTCRDDLAGFRDEIFEQFYIFVELLKDFITETGKIIPARLTNAPCVGRLGLRSFMLRRVNAISVSFNDLHILNMHTQTPRMHPNRCDEPVELQHTT